MFRLSFFVQLFGPIVLQVFFDLNLQILLNRFVVHEIGNDIQIAIDIILGSVHILHNESDWVDRIREKPARNQHNQDWNDHFEIGSG